MNPRKSSTSSANSFPPRPRYLGIEVAGDPSFSSKVLERRLAAALERLGPGPRVRVIRWEPPRALVEIDHGWAARARTAWNASLGGPADGGAPVAIATRRTWGTLRKGKAWLRSRPTGSAGTDPPRRSRGV